MHTIKEIIDDMQNDPSSILQYSKNSFVRNMFDLAVNHEKIGLPKDREYVPGIDFTPNRMDDYFLRGNFWMQMKAAPTLKRQDLKEEKMVDIWCRSLESVSEFERGVLESIRTGNFFIKFPWIKVDYIKQVFNV